MELPLYKVVGAVFRGILWLLLNAASGALIEYMKNLFVVRAMAGCEVACCFHASWEGEHSATIVVPCVDAGGRGSQTLVV